jgi:hypothetical protein
MGGNRLRRFPRARLDTDSGTPPKSVVFGGEKQAGCFF